MAYDPSGLISGLDDLYVLEGSEDIDYEEGLEYDADIVTGIITDDYSDVGLSTPGVYTVSYTLIIDGDAIGEKPIDDIIVYRMVDVVDDDRAVELTAEGKTVWCGSGTAVDIVDEDDAGSEEAQTAKEEVENTVSENTADSSGAAKESSDSDISIKDSTTSSLSSLSAKKIADSSNSSSTKSSQSGSSSSSMRKVSLLRDNRG